MKKLIYLFAATLLFSLWSCSEDDNKVDAPNKPVDPENAQLDISTYDLVFEAQGGEETFEIYCNTDWTITNESDWCTLDKTSGEGNATITVTTEVYYENEDQNTVLTIKAGDKTETLTVTQKDGEALILSKDKFDVPQEGGNISIELQSNVNCSLSIPYAFDYWIQEAPDSKGLETTAYNLTIAENKELELREGYVIVKANDLKDTIYIYQAQLNQLIFSQDTFNLQAEGGDITVELRTNVDYNIVIPADAASWISQVETKALREDKVTLHIDNNEGENRSAQILFEDKNSDWSDTLYIFQGMQGTYTGNVILETNEDIKTFAEYGMTKIAGDLIIQGREIKTLTQLNNTLEEIDGDLIIQCSEFTSFDGLYGLKRIAGDFIIDGSNETINALKSFEGLNNLNHIGGNFQILAKDNALNALTTFDGLENLTIIHGNFEINCAIKMSFRAGSILKNLSSFKGLSNLKTIGGDFKIIAHTNIRSSSRLSVIDKLESFEGLENLTTIGGNFEIDASANNGYDAASASASALKSLTSFKGLSNLKTIGGDFIINASNGERMQQTLYALSTFEGLENLTRIDGDFKISVSKVHVNSNIMSELTSFKGLNNLQNIGGDFELKTGTSGNSIPDLPISSFEGLESLSTISGNFITEKSLDVKNYISNLSFVGGNLKLFLYFLESPTINLKEVGGNFSISGGTNLSLPRLQTIGGNCHISSDMIDISNLESIGGSLTVSYSNISINKLQNVGDITIEYCENLYDFCNWIPILTDYNGTFLVTGCGYNPTKYKILNGECSQTPEN